MKSQRENVDGAVLHSLDSFFHFTHGKKIHGGVGVFVLEFFLFNGFCNFLRVKIIF